MFNAIALTDSLLSTGGFTRSLLGDSPQPGDKLFAVAFSKDTERCFSLATFQPEDLVEFIADNAETLATPAVYLGGWVDAGFVYLDCSIITADENEAMRIAHENDQLAIFCFEDMTSKVTTPLAKAA